MAVLFITSPAALHECFEHSQLEFFYGHADALPTARDKRHASFASNSLRESAPGTRATWRSAAVRTSTRTGRAVSSTRRSISIS